jgi:polyisoprenoid-binding protein YceI
MAPRSFKATLALVISLALVCRGLSYARDSRVGVLTLDPSKTLVEFRLGGALHTCHGQFKLKRGSIEADEATGKSEGEIVVDATSGQSGDFLRDDRMKDNVLEAAKWPEITFNPRRIDGRLDAQGNFHAKLMGVLTLRGTRHDVVMDTQGSLHGSDLIATGHVSIPYVAWGLKDPSMLFLTVAKEVEISIATAGHISWQSRAPAS